MCAGYVACGEPAVAIVYHRRDHRSYYMCSRCADHNVRNRGGLLLERKETMKKAEVKIDTTYLVKVSGKLVPVRRYPARRRTAAGLAATRRPDGRSGFVARAGCVRN